MYSFLQPVLFKLDPEKAHELALGSMQKMTRQPWLLAKTKACFADKLPELPVSCMGLDFAHPIGLAAGLDKDARAYAALAALGFSGVEMGTVTPKPQPGNDKPRLFRLIEDKAVINRMGFNSAGVDAFLQNLKNQPNGAANSVDDLNKAVAGINIGKNAVTDIADAHYDYVSALQRVYSAAGYITVNISSPNTKSLRDLQNVNYLDDLLSKIKAAHAKCAKVHKKQVPIALKVAPDLSSDEIEAIAELIISHQFDALIATNTTVARPDDLRSEHSTETGGLSGRPLKQMSTDCIAEFYRHLQGRVQIIGVGGIESADDAWQKLLAGADYLQVYSAFIYEGPVLIKRVLEGLQEKLQQRGFETIEQAMAQLRNESS